MSLLQESPLAVTVGCRQWPLSVGRALSAAPHDAADGVPRGRAGGFHHSLFIISSPPLRNRIETAPDHGHDFGIEACHRPFRMSAEPGVANQNRKE